MRVLRSILVLSTLVVTAACGREPAPPAYGMSQVGSHQLQTPAQTVPAAPVAQGSFYTPHGYAAPVYPAYPVHPVAAVAEAAPAPAPEARPEPAERPRVSRRSGGSAPAPRAESREPVTWSEPAPEPRREPRVVTVKNTKRDAAIGAATGAVIGAVAGGKDHRVRGAVIGAVVGGAAGAVIGSTIDKSTRVEY